VVAGAAGKVVEVAAVVRAVVARAAVAKAVADKVVADAPAVEVEAAEETVSSTHYNRYLWRGAPS